MKRTIRRGVFETNSSSVHSLVMCSNEEWNSWKRGDVLLYAKQFDTKENIIADLKTRRWYSDCNFDSMSEDEWQEICDDYHIFTYESWNKYVDRNFFETFNSVYTTPNGEVIHAFGYHGYD